MYYYNIKIEFSSNSLIKFIKMSLGVDNELEIAKDAVKNVNIAHIYWDIIVKHNLQPLFKEVWKKPSIYREQNPYLVNACRDNWRAYINYLLKSSYWDCELYTECLRQSAKYGNKDMIKYVIGKSINKLQQSRIQDAHTSACKIGAMYGHMNVVKFFIEKGMCEPFTICSAIDNKHHDIARYLHDKIYS